MSKQTIAAIRHPGATLDYADACEMARQVDGGRLARIVHIDLESTSHTTTAALARLVLLRRLLLQRGSDLRITGLRGRARALYEISRLGKLLPVVM